MGLYDRDYSRGPEPGFQISAPTTATMQLVLITAAVYAAQWAIGERVADALALKANWFLQPWLCYQLLTYGFLHSLDDVGHILVNMLILWMFGREIEQRYGKREFLAFYLCAIVAGGLVWSLSESLYMWSHGLGAIADQRVPRALGASGAITALVVLFALNYPHRQVLFMFFIPMPMWLAAMIGVLFDVRGAIVRSGNVAFMDHLGGALFALLYYRFGWTLGRLIPERLKLHWPGTKPRLRVHEPDEEGELSQKVDAILQKIQEQGQDSLTWTERRLLEKASRRYQEKRK